MFKKSYVNVTPKNREHSLKVEHAYNILNPDYLEAIDYCM